MFSGKPQVSWLFVAGIFALLLIIPIIFAFLFKFLDFPCGAC